MNKNDMKRPLSENAPSVSRRRLNALTAGLRQCGKILAAYESDPRGSDLGDLYCRMSYLRREKFLAALEQFLKKFTRADVCVMCSHGADMPDGGRRIFLTNAPQDGAEYDERLVINITGLDGGALIPLISIADSHPTLEGVINVASDRPEVGSDPALDFLAAAAPLIAQWFRNLKNYAGYIAACAEEGEGARFEMVHNASRSISARQIDRLKRGLEEKGYGMTGNGGNLAKRQARRVRRTAFAAMLALAVLMFMGSYDWMPVMSEFFNQASALVSEVGRFLGMVPK